MLLILDRRIPEEAKEKLRNDGIISSRNARFLELETGGIVHPAISGHPDIFFCRTPGKVIVSPSIPIDYKDIFTAEKIPFAEGTGKTSMHHPGPVHYSAAVSDHHFVHHLEFTDPVLLENCHYLNKTDVRQGYTSACLLLLRDNHYITSDHGIHEALVLKGLTGIYVNPAEILLPGFTNGQVAGAMGIYKDFIYILGSFKHYGEGEKIRKFLTRLNYSLIELYDGPLTDRGGILFLEGN
jgi:hypothetical protein